jgi:hypothetical protein
MPVIHGTPSQDPASAMCGTHHPVPIRTPSFEMTLRGPSGGHCVALPFLQPIQSLRPAIPKGPCGAPTGFVPLCVTPFSQHLVLHPLTHFNTSLAESGSEQCSVSDSRAHIADLALDLAHAAIEFAGDHLFLVGWEESETFTYYINDVLAQFWTEPFGAPKGHRSNR